MRCDQCQREVPEGAKFCGYCGRAFEGASLGPPVGVRPASSEAAGEPTRRGVPWVWIGGLAGLGMALLAYWLVRVRGGAVGIGPEGLRPAESVSVVDQFRDALQQGRLVTPWGQSAYDLYLRLKGDPSVKPEKLWELETQVVPVLDGIRQGVFQKWRDESKLDVRFSDWSDFCRVLEWLTALRSDATYRAELFYCRGQAAFVGDDYDRALEAFRQALNLRPDWALALNAVGRCYVRKQDWDQAEAYYRRAMAADPGWVYPVMNLAGVYLQRKQYGEAERFYRRALELAPQKPFIYYSLGQVYILTHRRAQACEAWRKALAYGEGQSPTDLGFDPAALRRQMARWGC